MHMETAYALIHPGYHNSIYLSCNTCHYTVVNGYILIMRTYDTYINMISLRKLLLHTSKLCSRANGTFILLSFRTSSQLNVALDFLVNAHISTRYSHEYRM